LLVAVKNYGIVGWRPKKHKQFAAKTLFTQNLKMVNKKVGLQESQSNIKCKYYFGTILATSSHVFALLNCISDTFIFRPSATFLGNRKQGKDAWL